MSTATPPPRHHAPRTPRIRTALTLALLLTGAARCAWAEEPLTSDPAWLELSERLDQIEFENEQLRSMVCADRRRSPSRRDWSIEFAGRIHIDLWSYPSSSPGVNAFESGDSTISPQDRLELRRARFEAQGNLPGRMSYDLDFELSEASDPEFRDLFIEWNDLPLLHTIRFGNQKRPYGLDHLNSSNFNVFLERPFIVQAFNRNNRRFGLAAYGLSRDEAWNWRYGVFNLRELQTDGEYVSDHYQLEMAGRLAHTCFDRCDESSYLHTAVSANYAEPDGVPTPGRERNQARFRTEPEARTESQWLDTGTIDGAEQYSILGAEAVFGSGQLQVTGEYLNLWLGRRTGFGESLHFHGGYLQIAYFLTPHYQPWDRRLGTIGRVRSFNGCWRDAWQAAVRWSYADLSSQDVQGGVGQSISTAVNWYWTPRARMQFNCIYGEITDHFPVDGQTEGDYVALGTRVMVDF